MNKEARVAPDVVARMFLVNGLHALLLFDSGATRSFMSVSFSEGT